MNKKKKIILGIVMILCLMAIFSPPIMIARGAIIFGERTESFSMEDHLKEEDTEFVNRKEYYTKPFDDYYILNFRPWEKMHIERTQYYKPVPEAKVKSFSPFIYRVERANKNAYHDTLEIQRGGKNWYMDFYWMDKKRG